jgi:hypothetical protein
MGRSKGYRPRPENVAEVRELRARLAKLNGSEWQLAYCIMKRIASLSKNPLGPMRGQVMPRCCAVCGYFGHTKQHCPVRRAREELALDEEIEAERKRQLGQWDPELGGYV